MLRSAGFLGFALAVALLPVAGSAQTAAPKAIKHDAMLHPATPMRLANPGHRSNAGGTRSGAGCIAGVSGPSVNPITGKLQAAPVVEVPLSAGAGNVASATTHAQQTQACAHGH